MSKKKQDPLYTPAGLEATLLDRYQRWKNIYENGCSDPFWPDGVNINLCRNHIIYQKKVCEYKLGDKFGLYPDSYFYPIPDEVPCDFMAKPRKINSNVTPIFSDKPYSSMLHFDWSELLRDEIPAE